MAAWTVAFHSHRGRQRLLRRQFFGTRKIGVGRAAAGLTSRSQPLASHKAAGWSSRATNPAGVRECLAGERFSSGGRRQELLWRQFFLDQTRWGHNTQQKKRFCSPDFRHKESQLVALDMPMGGRAPTTKSSLSDDPAPCRPAGYERSMTAETVRKLCQQGQLSKAVEALAVLVQTGCRISKSLFYAVLKRCIANKDLVLGRRVHTLIVNAGCESDTFLCNHILRMYASHARLQEAMDVFTVVAKPDAFMWSSIISAHVRHGQAKQAIQLYHQMRSSDVKPDGHVFVAALQACASGADLKTGQQVHADVLASGVEPHLFVCNCLVDMYAKCSRLADARMVFNSLAVKDVVTWNAMIGGYVQQGKGHEALHLYSSMQQHGVTTADSVTFVCLLQACINVGAMAIGNGKQLHAQIEEQELTAEVAVGNSLVNMYAKCGSLEDAQSVFNRIPRKDVVTWASIISAHVTHKQAKQAIQLYHQMRSSSVKPDGHVFVAALQACASSADLKNGQQVHADVLASGIEPDRFVCNCLVDMYAKCGSLKDAQSLFDGIRQKDVVTWTAIIAGYAQQGMGQEALRLYSAMQHEGLTPPNSVTFVCLLQACATVADLHQGRKLHAQIEERGLQADVVVGCSLINMYAKAGSMVDAQHVFDTMPERDIVAWDALIGGYTRQGDSEVVFELVHRMREDGVQLTSITFLSILTVCSHAGLVNKGREYFEAMCRHHGITPTLEHYTCMVDLLGRAGQFDEALEVVRAMAEMHVQPNHALWHTLLGACRKWSNVKVGQHAFHEAVRLDEKDAAAYVLMSNIYTAAQMCEEAQEMQERRKEIGAWKQPGQSWWTDLGGIVHTFVVGDEKHPRVKVHTQG